jgi:hypothetical protein
MIPSMHIKTKFMFIVVAVFGQATVSGCIDVGSNRTTTGAHRPTWTDCNVLKNNLGGNGIVVAGDRNFAAFNPSSLLLLRYQDGRYVPHTSCRAQVRGYGVSATGRFQCGNYFRSKAELGAFVPFYSLGGSVGFYSNYTLQMDTGPRYESSVNFLTFAQLEGADCHQVLGFARSVTVGNFSLGVGQSSQGGAVVGPVNGSGQQSLQSIDSATNVPILVDVVRISSPNQITCPQGQRFDPSKNGCVIDSSKIQYGIHLIIEGRSDQCDSIPNDACDFDLRIMVNGFVIESPSLSENSNRESYSLNRSFSEMELTSGSIMISIFDRDLLTPRDHLGSCSIRFTQDETFRAAAVGPVQSRRISCDRAGIVATITRR